MSAASILSRIGRALGRGYAALPADIVEADARHSAHVFQHGPIVWKTVLAPEPKRLPNNGSRTEHPKVLIANGAAWVNSEDLAYYLNVPHARFIDQWDRVMSRASEKWRIANLHQMTLPSWGGTRGGVPFHHRYLRVTKQAGMEVMARLDKKQCKRVAHIFSHAAATGTATQEFVSVNFIEQMRLSDIAAVRRIETRAASGLNCTDKDYAVITLADPRWESIKVEVIREAFRGPVAYGRCWEVVVRKLPTDGRFDYAGAVGWSEARQEYLPDSCLTIPDAFLSSLDAVEDFEVAQRLAAEKAGEKPAETRPMDWPFPGWGGAL